LVAAAIRTIFARLQADMVRKQLGVIAGMLVRQFPKAEAMLRDAAPEVLAFADGPPTRWNG
jgi:putative transposase